MSLSTPETVQKLQAALHAKAKGSPRARFYTLYDKIYRPDVLRFAYQCCKANRGAAGVDGRTFADIESCGLGRWLGELAHKAYRAVDRHARHRRRQWLRKKHVRKGRATSRFPAEHLYDQLGVVRLPHRTARFPSANA